MKKSRKIAIVASVVAVAVLSFGYRDIRGLVSDLRHNYYLTTLKAGSGSGGIEMGTALFIFSEERIDLEQTPGFVDFIATGEPRAFIESLDNSSVFVTANAAIEAGIPNGHELIVPMERDFHYVIASGGNEAGGYIVSDFETPLSLSLRGERAKQSPLFEKTAGDPALSAVNVIASVEIVSYIRESRASKEFE